MRKIMIAALSTLCLTSLTASSCGERIQIVKPPAEKLVCDPLPATPKLTPLDWSKMVTVNEARVLVQKREGETADYIVALRGAWFSCSSDVEWHRDYNAALP